MKKIETLAKALKEKPALKLDIEGGVDMKRDRDGIIQAQFQRKLEIQKMNAMIRRGEKVESVDEIEIEKPEYDRYLKRPTGLKSSRSRGTSSEWRKTCRTGRWKSSS